MKNKKKSEKKLCYSLFLISLLIVAFGHNIWVNYLSYIAAFIGYALFFRVIKNVKNNKNRFFIALFWFLSLQLIGLSWMSSTTYVGNYIYIAYLLLSFAFAAQFGIWILFFPKGKKDCSMLRILFLASIWAIFEWSRLFILSGYTFNPVAMALLNNRFSMQLAAFLGIYGLSFWVLLTNIWGYRALFIKRKMKYFIIWIIFFIIPYLFGYLHENFQKKYFKEPEKLSVLLVQTAIYPHEKEFSYDNRDVFISPTNQWKKSLEIIKKHQNKNIDLIVFPEAAIVFGANTTYYSFSEIIKIWSEVFGEKDFSFLPSVEEPFAKKIFFKDKYIWKFSNSYIALALANYFNSDVIIGFDDINEIKNQNYNAAFHFTPHSTLVNRYKKQVLVPIVEYIPFDFCRKIAGRYGINDFFTKGKSSKVFKVKNIPFSVSICYEETFGNIIKNFKKNGANFLINISNDAWFPNSILPMMHYELGKVRACENGLPIIRSCNTGITAGVDCFGKEIAKIGKYKITHEKKQKALFITFLINNYFTLYSIWGNGLIILISLFFIILFIYIERKKEFKRNKRSHIINKRKTKK